MVRSGVAISHRRWKATHLWTAVHESKERRASDHVVESVQRSVVSECSQVHAILLWSTGACGCKIPALCVGDNAFPGDTSCCPSEKSALRYRRDSEGPISKCHHFQNWPARYYNHSSAQKTDRGV